VAALPVVRLGSGHHATGINGCFSSATAIRRQLSSSSFIDPVTANTMPPNAVAIFSQMLAEGTAPADPSRIDSHILAKLRSMKNLELLSIPECSEGLENRLVRSANLGGTVKALLEHLKSRRYPYTRLQRIMAHVLLGTTKSQLVDFDRSGPLYARVLAFNKKGRTALRSISRRSSIPLINKTTAFLNSRSMREENLSPLQTMLTFDVTATDIFTLCLPNPSRRIGGLDFKRSAVYSENT